MHFDRELNILEREQFLNKVVSMIHRTKGFLKLLIGLMNKCLSIYLKDGYQINL